MFALAIMLLGLGGSSAQAAEAAQWTPNGESPILGPTEALLVGTNTSVETTDLSLTVAAGDEVGFEYGLADGAECPAGSLPVPAPSPAMLVAPRVATPTGPATICPARVAR